MHDAESKMTILQRRLEEVFASAQDLNPRFHVQTAGRTVARSQIYNLGQASRG
jgi:hypothetical protein